MWIVRRSGLPRVTIQPSKTQAHQSRCRNRTVSARIDAKAMEQLLHLAGCDPYFFEGASHVKFAASLVSPVPL